MTLFFMLSVSVMLNVEMRLISFQHMISVQSPPLCHNNVSINRYAYT